MKNESSLSYVVSSSVDNCDIRANHRHLVVFGQSFLATFQRTSRWKLFGLDVDLVAASVDSLANPRGNRVGYEVSIGRLQLTNLPQAIEHISALEL